MLGPRANVILANPNGIRVNGLTVTTGNLALTTGQVTFNYFVNANGQSHRHNDRAGYATGTAASIPAWSISAISPVSSSA